MESNRTILFIGHAPHAVACLSNLAAMLRLRGRESIALLRGDCSQLPKTSFSEFKEIRSHEWHSRSDVEPRGLRRLARRPFRQTIRNVRMRDEVRRVLDRERPLAMVLTTDTAFPEAMFVRVGQRLGIPAVCVQWAFSLPQGHYDAMRAAPSAGKPRTGIARRGMRAVAGILDLIASHALGLSFRFRRTFGGGESRGLAVMGEAFADQFEAQGVDPARIMVTGHPMHDDLITRDKMRSRGEVLQILGLEDERIVLFTTQPHLHYGMLSRTEWECFTLQVCEAALLDERNRLVVKIHPRESLHEYESLLGMRQGCAIIQDMDIVSLTEAADAVVTQFSTTALTAMGLMRPVVLANFMELSGAEFFSGIEGLSVARTPNELVLRLEELLENESTRLMACREQRQALGRYALVDGLSSERLADFIDELIREAHVRHARG